MRKRLDLPMENRIKELHYAIVQSVPVMLGYLFLGFAFGLMLMMLDMDSGGPFLSACLYMREACNLSWLRYLQPEQACGIH